MSRTRKPPELQPDEQQYIRDHHKRQSVPKMAKHLRRAPKLLYDWMKPEGLEPLDERGSKAAAHPFKFRNGQLRAVYEKRLAEGREYNPRGRWGKK